MITYVFDKKKAVPLYMQLYRSIKEDIEQGKLTSGTRLPSKRSFAENLGVSTITVENAYEKLVSEGYIRSVSRSGFFVEDIELPVSLDGRGTSGVGADENKIKRTAGFSGEEAVEIKYDFTSNMTVKTVSPFLTWSKIARKVMAENQDEILTVAPSNGTQVLRYAIARHIWGFRGMNVNPENIVIGAGTEYLYSLIIQLLGRDKIYALEEPGYDKIAKVYTANGVAIRYIPLDENGIDIDRLSESDADIFHISPTHHFPTGIVTQVARRYEILRLAEERGDCYIIEDDYDSELGTGGKPMQTLMEMDRGGRVIYMNTFTKTLSATIRISYMILPDELAEKFHKNLGFYSCTVSNFQQYTLARFIDEGFFESRIRRLRRYYAKEKEVLIKELSRYRSFETATLGEKGAGQHILIYLWHRGKDNVDSIIKAKALSNGIKINTLSDYYRDKSEGTGVLVLNYSSIPIEEIPAAVKLLDEAIG